ncbi:MAG: hypothetical protein HY934_04410 [Candidatus Firestonebacteria bacterium]|nr:hypothetical protein [Candidatus Firestonebacteria bacterium]
MKKITIVYNSAIKDEIMDLLEQCGIKSYTRIENVFGSGKTSGPHLGTNVWPGNNDFIIVVVEDSIKNIFMEKIKPLKASLAKEVLKAFVENVEEII